MCNHLYQELEKDLLEHIMNLDLFYMIKHLLRVNTKEQVLLFLKSLADKTTLGR